ncbi:SDR family NAD(P)-dependent oxidoreductase [Mycolicibacterium moriokaense]|uniref:Short subunit dehydrogenase n=1 Tax=Mycolicibacterium moriokaense TaxID=39691 RepID=A0A318HDB4_9MYCO|nr:SDR family NAD(P)-dependent oxidoreductase [Mycolicibacterium moriokaense]PXX01681.1 short subunit dehydrogenase [Mycolicibacterium moriokaense]
MSILVTGGTEGIGRAIADPFAAPGVTVFVACASDDEAEHTFSAIADKAMSSPAHAIVSIRYR